MFVVNLAEFKYDDIKNGRCSLFQALHVKWSNTALLHDFYKDKSTKMASSQTEERKIHERRRTSSNIHDENMS